jgi:hypothetical protein
VRCLLGQDVGADGFAQTFDVGGGGLARVDHEVGVQLAELGAAAPMRCRRGVQLAAPARLIDQPVMPVRGIGVERDVGQDSDVGHRILHRTDQDPL